jgi:hypothetical protein
MKCSQWFFQTISCAHLCDLHRAADCNPEDYRKYGVRCKVDTTQLSAKRRSALGWLHTQFISNHFGCLTAWRADIVLPGPLR